MPYKVSILKKTCFIILIFSLSLLFTSQLNAQTTDCAPTVPEGISISNLDGQIGPEWVDAWLNINPTGYNVLMIHLKHDDNYLYVGLINRQERVKPKNFSYAEITFDKSMNKGMTPQTDDALLKINQDGVITYFEGDGTTWIQKSKPATWLAATSKTGGPGRGNSYASYEFKIPLNDLNFNNITRNIGFSAHVYGNETSVHNWFPDYSDFQDPPIINPSIIPNRWAKLYYGWSYDTGFSSLGTPSIFSSLGYVYTATSQNIHRINQLSGAGNIFINTGFNIFKRAPVGSLFGQNILVAAGSDGKIHVYNAESGAIIWESSALGDSIQGGVTGHFYVNGDPAKNYFYAGTFNLSQTNNDLKAVDIYTGQIMATFHPGNMDVITSSPVVDYQNNIVYLTSKSNSGTQPSLWAINPADMSTLWSKNLGDITSSAVTGQNGTIIVAADNGTLYKFDKNGNQICTYALGSKTENYVYSLSGKIYLSTANNGVYGFQELSNSFDLLFNNTLINRPSVPVVKLQSNRIYVGSDDSRIYEINASNGDIMNVVKVSQDLSALGSPAFNGSNSYICFGSSAGLIYYWHTPLK